MCYCKGQLLCNRISGEKACVFCLIVNSAWITVLVGRQLEDWLIVELMPIEQV